MKKIVTIIALISFLFSTVLPANLTFAQTVKKIKEIKIVGNIRVSKSNILNKIKTHEGDLFDAKTTSQDIKKIFQMGYFSDVKIDVKEDADGVVVLFIIAERPLLQSINIKGANKIKLKNILKALTVKEGEILNQRDVLLDVKTIEEMYLKKGYFGTKIDYDVDEDSATNRAILNIKIKEGSKLKVKKITIEGNKSFKEKKILKVLKTKRKSLFNSGKFKEEQFKEDLDQIRAFYYTKGYMDIQILDVKKTFSDSGKYMYVTIVVDEGKTYQVGSVTVVGNELFPLAEITKRISLKKDTTYLPETMQKDLESVTDFYLEKGYISVRINPEKKLNTENQNLDIVFNIKENELCYINQIKVVGNKKTKDIVVRREFNIYPGEVFDGVKIKRSIERLENMGFFDKVTKQIAPTQEENKKDLIIEVQEGKTGELGFGAGYSSVDKLIGFVEIAQKNFDYKNFPNFTGAGQKLRFRSEFGSTRKDFVLSFTEPWFMGKMLSFGFDVFSRNSSYDSNDFDESRKGFTLRLGKPLAPFVRGDIAYTYETVDIYNVSDSASSYIKNEAGKRDISKIIVDINRDTRNSWVSPSKGAKLDLITEFSGLGGNVHYYKVTGIYDQFLSLDPFIPFDVEGHVLECYFKVGVVDNFGESDDVPIFEKFFLGGGAPNVRGFDYREISPRDEFNDPIGGKTMGNFTIEYSFALIDNLRPCFFYDAGSVFAGFGEFDLNKINASVGLGLKIFLPIGPLRLDYGIPVQRDENNKDASAKFTFNVGTVF